jgi:hypothetical protein
MRRGCGECSQRHPLGSRRQRCPIGAAPAAHRLWRIDLSAPAAIALPLFSVSQIFVMASVLPSSGDDSHSGALTAARDWSLLEEVAKSLISLVEVAGVQATLQLTPNLAKFGAGTRVLAIALGMSFAESALRYAIPLFVGARGAEFSWNYLEMGLASNVALLLHLAFVATVWLRTRTDLGRAAMPVVWTIIAANAVLPSVDKSE